MSESTPQEAPQFQCPKCGMLMTRTDDGDVDDAAVDDAEPRQIEYTCPGGHRVVVTIVETFDDDDPDSPYSDG